MVKNLLDSGCCAPEFPILYFSVDLPAGENDPFAGFIGRMKYGV